MLAGLVIAVYVLLLWTAMRWRKRGPVGAWSRLLRGFLPNWQFFDRLGHRPILQVRQQSSHHGWSAWRSFRPKANRTWFGLFHQPQVCAQLFKQSLIDQLAIELGDQRLSHEAIFSGSAYVSICEFARALALSESPDATRVQFRLLLIDPLLDTFDPAQMMIEPMNHEDERLILLSEPLLIPFNDLHLSSSRSGNSS